MADPRSVDRSEWTFSELLEWHLRRGTRPDGNPSAPGRVWSTKEFGDVAGYTDRSVRNWRLGRTLPVDITTLERTLFGGSEAYTAWRNEFREAYSQGNRSFEEEMQELREKRQTGGETRLSIEDFQVYTSETPLIAGAALVTLSIFLGPHHNQVRSVEDLVGFHGPLDLSIEHAGHFDDLVTHLLSEMPRSLHEQLKWSIQAAIDDNDAILYNGSVKPVKTEQLAKLPTVLKAFATLSKRQFRLGLFRLSATIVVISVSGGAAAYTGWAATKKVHAVASSVIPALALREK